MKPFFSPLFALLALFGAERVVADPAPDGWAFQELKKPPVPEVSDGPGWARSDLDRFVLWRMRPMGLEPVGEAEPATLLRRATVDLTGLPPTASEIENFLADESPDAYEKAIERLLASPHYGERWGRHWLDVARYVQGTIKVRGVEQIDMAAAYRDYVVRALNADKPYDRFITEQVAGDLLPPPEDETQYLDQITAPAFLSIGSWFEECTDPNRLRLDIIDEQMTTLGQAVLGLNFNCARCHDHKFDPIPTRDYYALAGNLRSTRITERFSEEWRDGRPRMVRPFGGRGAEQDYRRAMERRDDLLAVRWETLEQARKRVLKKGITGDVPRSPVHRIEAEDFAGQKDLRVVALGDGEAIESQKPDDQWAKYEIEVEKPGPHDLYVRYAAGKKVPVAIELNRETILKDLVLNRTGGRGELTDEHCRWEKLATISLEDGKNSLKISAPKHRFFPRIDCLELFPAGGEGKAFPVVDRMRRGHWPPTIADTETLASEPVRQELAAIDAQLTEVDAAIDAAELVLAVADEAEPINEPVRRSGNVYDTDGDPVPRGLPVFLDGLVPRDDIPETESGRRQLAEWLTHPKNPLTARVIANRLWHWHFGCGLAGDPSDLSMESLPPSNRALLDWLAATLIEENWSLKAMHRVIMTSATYRLSSAADARSLEIDPDTRFHWRWRPRRLEAEAIYDAMITTIGKVPRQPAGQALDVNKSKDRALYILTSARSPVGLGQEVRKMFDLFGFDPSGRPIHIRQTAATPGQALFWLNNPLPEYFAGKFADRLVALEGLDDRGRAAVALRDALGKPPGDAAIDRTLAYRDFCRNVEKLGDREAWARVCLGIYSSDAFSYLK